MFKIYTRLKPSKIQNAGVGVFSIGVIPKEINPFEGCTTKLRTMSNDEFQSLDEQKKKMVKIKLNMYLINQIQFQFTGKQKKC